MADSSAAVQPQHAAPSLPTDTAAAMADSSVSSDGSGAPASVSVRWPTSSSVLLSHSAATLELFPYPTFAEAAAADTEDDDDDEDDHWLDLALSAPPLRSSALPTSAPPAAVSSALSALRAAHRSSVESQQLSSVMWQAVKDQTRQHLLDSCTLPIQQRRPPSAANVATLNMEESQSRSSRRQSTLASHTSVRQPVAVLRRCTLQLTCA